MFSILFYFLSKIFHFLILPLTWVLFFFILSTFFKNSLRKRFFILGLSLLLFFSNPFIIHQVLRWWEIPPTPLSTIQTKYQVGIVLGGINLNKKPTDRTYLTRGADRIMHAVLLYREGVIKKILITGGGKDSIFNSEAEQLVSILKTCQIPEKDILLETKALNTYENALFSKELLQTQKIKEPYLLITSAYHMPRARACFKKQGLKTDEFTADFLTSDYRGLVWINVFVPSASALTHWQVVIHEWIGLVTYKLMGYI